MMAAFQPPSHVVMNVAASSQDTTFAVTPSGPSGPSGPSIQSVDWLAVPSIPYTAQNPLDLIHLQGLWYCSIFCFCVMLLFLFFFFLLLFFFHLVFVLWSVVLLDRIVCSAPPLVFELVRDDYSAERPYFRMPIPKSESGAEILTSICCRKKVCFQQFHSSVQLFFYLTNCVCVFLLQTSEDKYRFVLGDSNLTKKGNPNYLGKMTKMDNRYTITLAAGMQLVLLFYFTLDFSLHSFFFPPLLITTSLTSFFFFFFFFFFFYFY
jgi:hypothetical protein